MRLAVQAGQQPLRPAFQREESGGKERRSFCSVPVLELNAAFEEITVGRKSCGRLSQTAKAEQPQVGAFVTIQTEGGRDRSDAFHSRFVNLESIVVLDDQASARVMRVRPQLRQEHRLGELPSRAILLIFVSSYRIGAQQHHL